MLQTTTESQTWKGHRRPQSPTLQLMVQAGIELTMLVLVRAPVLVRPAELIFKAGHPSLLWLLHQHIISQVIISYWNLRWSKFIRYTSHFLYKGNVSSISAFINLPRTYPRFTQMDLPMIFYSLSAWRKEGSEETLEHLPVLRWVTKELERDILEGYWVTGQGAMALNWREEGLDQMLGKNS